MDFYVNWHALDIYVSYESKGKGVLKAHKIFAVLCVTKWKTVIRKAFVVVIKEFFWIYVGIVAALMDEFRGFG